MKTILVLLAVLIAVARCEHEQSSGISRDLTPPQEDDSDSSDLWQKQSQSTTTDSSLKTTKDSYLPIEDDRENSSTPRIKTTTSHPPKKGAGNPSKLNPIPESDDEVENFEESAQSYYGRGFGGGYGGRFPSYGGGYGGGYYNNYRRPYPYRPYGGYYGYGR